MNMFGKLSIIAIVFNQLLVFDIRNSTFNLKYTFVHDKVIVPTY